jgi:hypothetical protein
MYTFDPQGCEQKKYYFLLGPLFGHNVSIELTKSKLRMTTTPLISIIGASSAITVSLIGAWLANRNSIVLQTKKLKEDHYIGYIEALHNNMTFDQTNEM